jgi:hypothetical protein
MAFIYHLYYTDKMSFTPAVSQFPDEAKKSLTHPIETLMALPAKVVKFMGESGVFLVVVLILLWLFTGWHLSLGFKKSGLGNMRRSRFGNFSGNIGIFDGAGLARRAAQSDDVTLGWDMPTREGFSAHGDNRINGFQHNWDKDIGPKSSFGSREPPFFSEVSNDNLRSEDQQRAAVVALAKINAERARRRPDDPYDPLPWAPFWEEWQKNNDDPYLSHINYENQDPGQMEGLVGKPAHLNLRG